MAIRKTITLKNYQGDYKNFDITLPTNEEKITIVYTIQAGDEVVYIFVYNNLIYTLDSCADDDVRGFDLLDQIKILTLKELEELHHD